MTTQAPGGSIVVAGTLDEPGTVTISGRPAVVDANKNFRGTVPTTAGTNTLTIVARDATGNALTQQYELAVSGAVVSFVYDANGNQTDDGLRTMEWNARNQVASVSASGDGYDFEYDGFGRRVIEKEFQGSVQVTETSSVWSGYLALETRPATGPILRRHNGGLSQGSNSYWIAEDHLGSIRDIVSASAERIVQDNYDPSGRLTRSLTSSLPARFSHGSVSPFGVVDAVFRSFNPATGAWLSEDPAGFADGPNLYSYVRNSPVGLMDPLGEQGYAVFFNQCVRNVIADGNVLSRAGNSRRAHCITSCRLSRECGGNVPQAQAVGILKKIGDAVMCLATGVKRVCQSALQKSDFDDNLVGTLCVLTSEDCTSFCGNRVPPGTGPDGPMGGLGK